VRSVWGGAAGADHRWWDIDPVAAGVFGVPVGFLLLWLASLWGPQPSPAQVQMLDHVRSPAPR
jgi:cation/acetate symporter